MCPIDIYAWRLTFTRNKSEHKVNMLRKAENLNFNVISKRKSSRKSLFGLSCKLGFASQHFHCTANRKNARVKKNIHRRSIDVKDNQRQIVERKFTSENASNKLHSLIFVIALRNLLDEP